MTPPVTAASYIRKARRALAAARLLYANSDTEWASNRAYYAMHDAAHAALWAIGVEQFGAVIKSHGGLASIFGRELVQTGKVGPEHGRALGHVQKTRLLADYDADQPSEIDANEAITLAEAFVEAMDALIIGLKPRAQRRGEFVDSCVARHLLLCRRLRKGHGSPREQEPAQCQLSNPPTSGKPRASSRPARWHTWAAC